MVSIKGLSKPDVLAALYNRARPQGMGFLHYTPEDMTTEQAEKLLQQTYYFDYVNGRVMKVDLSSDEQFDERLYDRDNGPGADLCPRTEDPDIKRFKHEVSDYLGVPITYANMPGWDKKDQFDVCMELKAFKYGIQSSALCTQKMKTEPFHKWLSEHYPADPPHIREDISLVYGFDANEQNRIKRRIGIMSMMGYQTEYPLIWEQRTIYQSAESHQFYQNRKELIPIPVDRVSVKLISAE